MKTILKNIMIEAWKFFRTTGKEFSECLKQAWRNFKLVQAMKKGIVKFYFTKVNGEVREAWGTLNEKFLPVVSGIDKRKKNEFVQIYFDTEKQEYRCFKKLNLI
ncbi:DUF2693 domain-containing protein [Apibacter muscae]|uniref:SH3 beta-barrel fold-containing protein n=1 Tax=Apibacter muscae TaxID=2509004 RepID=UPI0011ABF3D2|nr:SH3 beta-barrel fold-containing protein [Apibacter muscae]TWP29352.1 DUF2693 domain-containing protein [Apibacter muscae]